MGSDERSRPRGSVEGGEGIDRTEETAVKLPLKYLEKKGGTMGRKAFDSPEPEC